MTIAELIKALQALPQDMKIQVMGSDEGGPVDIVQLSRGSWTSDYDPDEDEFDPEDAHFVQNDVNGDTAILVTW